MKPKSPIPAGVKEGVKKHLASVKKGAPGTIQKIAVHWGLTESAVSALAKREKSDINEMRARVSDMLLELGAQVAGEISKKLADPEAMAGTPLRDLGMTMDKLVNAGVTAADGHKPRVEINFGELRAGRSGLEEWDRRQREMKQVKGVEVA